MISLFFWQESHLLQPNRQETAKRTPKKAELVLPNPVIVSAGATVQFELMTVDNLVLATGYACRAVVDWALHLREPQNHQQ
jgi:hypothetical protein